MTDRNTAFIADFEKLLKKLEREKYTGNFTVNVKDGIVHTKLAENTVIDLVKLREVGAIQTLNNSDYLLSKPDHLKKWLGFLRYMNYNNLSKRKLSLDFAEMSKDNKKKCLHQLISRRKLKDDEKSPYEMVGEKVQMLLMGLWLNEVIDDPTGAISLELLKRAPESKKRAQINVDNTHKFSPALAQARALLKDASSSDLAKIVSTRARGKSPVKPIVEDAEFTDITD